MNSQSNTPGATPGDVVLTLEDPAYSSAQADMLSMSGMSEPGMSASGQTILDNIEHPHSVVGLLMPLVSEARHTKAVERQSTYMHVNPGMAAMGMAPAATPPPRWRSPRQGPRPSRRRWSRR